ncbi:MAG: hypothetical protein ACREK5_00510 [Gemmatimonadota bacterium]
MAATRAEDGRIFTAPVHILSLMAAVDAGAPLDPEAENLFHEAHGYVTTAGRFVTREEAKWLDGTTAAETLPLAAGIYERVSIDRTWDLIGRALASSRPSRPA